MPAKVSSLNRQARLDRKELQRLRHSMQGRLKNVYEEEPDIA